MENKQSSACVKCKDDTLLSIRDLQTSFFLKRGELKGVDHVSFDIYKGETIGIVGESGCGKSLTALSIMNLVPKPKGKIIGGEILFKNENLLEKTDKEIKKIQGKDIAMIFQEPMTSLNPVLTIGWQISENMRNHCHISRAEAKKRTIEMLKKVNIPMPERRYHEYPHQLSGGMRQRIMIAMALACNPSLLICDEPTTALDVTVQAEILRLIDSLKKENNMSVLLISHDLGVISELADRVIIMYAGEIVEIGKVDEIFTDPKHPYTKALLKSVPKIDKLGKERLYMIPGSVPDLVNISEQCRFADRCEKATDQCRKGRIPLKNYPKERKVRCCLYQEQNG
ncbi:MAG: ABC transporter ATP-binding protein [Faecalimonas umbilicata]